MLITCPFCKSKAIITSRATQTTTCSNLHCLCKNESCSAVFVYTLALSHTVHHPIKPTHLAAIEALKELPPLDLEKIMLEHFSYNHRLTIPAPH